jgi:glycosyltransferase involved in cell wall biosynthesis
MKILIVVPSHPKYSGVDFHRLVMPHNIIGHFNEDVEISMINEIDSAEIPFLTQFDFLVCNRFLSRIGDVDHIIEKLKAARLRYIVDLDDDYRLPHWHLLYAASQQSKHPERIIKGIKGAYAVTTTHEKLAATINLEIKKIKYGIVPNGILPIGQFEDKPTNFDKVHLGWSGSITHFEDVLLMHDSLKQIYLSDLKDSIRMVHGGYDGTDVTSQAIAGVLSAKGLAGPDTFQMYPARDVIGYAEFYDHINISLIPLRDNRFNNMKSNLKLLEAGFKRKAVIVSDVYPYSPLIEHGKNCLAVKHKNDWYKHMVRLIKEPNLRQDLADQLYEDVQDYHLERVANERLKFYKSIL